jgi:enoyl-CoA hydratase
MINYTRDHTVADSLKYIATWQAGMFRPEDMMKVFVAQQQKQAPEFEELRPIVPPFSAS